MVTDENHSKKVALVEDDFEYRALIEEFLRFSGLQVNAFAEAASFLRSRRGSESEYALVISDMSMPGMSGLELLREVRAQSDPVPVILITAAPNSRDEAICRKLGAHGYLSKPCPLAELLERVQAALRIRSFA